MSLDIREDNTDEAIEGIRRAVDRALETIGIVAEKHAKEYEVAYQTGHLRDSITHRVMNDEKAVYVGTNVEYGRFIELGHHDYLGVNEGRGFLRPTLTEHEDEYREILRNEMRG